MERSPASRLGIVAVDAEGEPAGLVLRRTDRPLGGALGRFCGARGRARRRGDDAGREPDRVGAVAARLLADGGGGAALQHAAAAARPGAAGRGRRPEALRRRGGAAGRAARRGADDDDGRGRRGPRRGPAAGDAGRDRGDGSRGPGADRLHLRHHRRAARRRPRLPLPARASGSRPSTGSARARASWPGARPPPAGRSRPATSSSPPG